VSDTRIPFTAEHGEYAKKANRFSFALPACYAVKPETRDESFSRENRLRKSTEFKRVFSRGRRIGTRYFVIYSLHNNLSASRIGIQVKAKIGSATKRNYIKRMVRETFRRMKNEFRQPVDLIFIAEKDIFNIRGAEFEGEFRKAVARYVK
jgi:ribonuclease P protein component